MRDKAKSMAVVSFTPGPDGTGPLEVVTRRPHAPNARIRSGMTLAAPMQQFTPDQSAFRDTAGSGRWAADPALGAIGPINSIRQNDQGCTDTVKLEPVHNDSRIDYYMDMGGQGGRDFGARRP